MAEDLQTLYGVAIMQMQEIDNYLKLQRDRGPVVLDDQIADMLRQLTKTVNNARGTLQEIYNAQGGEGGGYSNLKIREYQNGGLGDSDIVNRWPINRSVPLNNDTSTMGDQDLNQEFSETSANNNTEMSSYSNKIGGNYRNKRHMGDKWGDKWGGNYGRDYNVSHREMSTVFGGHNNNNNIPDDYSELTDETQLTEKYTFEGGARRRNSRNSRVRQSRQNRRY